MADIESALKKLDVGNDNHWTEAGEPRVDTVKMLAADPTLTRELINEAAKNFNRDTAVGYWLAGNAPAAPVEPKEQAATPAPQSGDPAASVVIAPPQEQGATAAPQAQEQASGAGSGIDPVLNADGETEQGKVDDDNLPITEDEIEAVEATEVEDAERALADVRASIDEHRTAIDEHRVAIDELAIEEASANATLAALNPNANSSAHAIQSYLESQKTVLQDRADRKAMIAESGINLNELAKNLKSPIDSAMSRKTGRGGSRPTR